MNHAYLLLLLLVALPPAQATPVTGVLVEQSVCRPGLMRCSYSLSGYGRGAINALKECPRTITMDTLTGSFTPPSASPVCTIDHKPAPARRAPG